MTSAHCEFLKNTNIYEKHFEINFRKMAVGLQISAECFELLQFCRSDCAVCAQYPKEQRPSLGRVTENILESTVNELENKL